MGMFSPSLISAILQCLPDFPFCFFHSFLKVLLGAVFPLALKPIYPKGHLAKLLLPLSLALSSSSLLLVDTQFSSRVQKPFHTVLISLVALGANVIQGDTQYRGILCPWCPSLLPCESWSLMECFLQEGTMVSLLNRGTSTSKPCRNFVPFSCLSNLIEIGQLVQKLLERNWQTDWLQRKSG